MDELADTIPYSVKPTSYVERLVGIFRLFSEGSETLGIKEISERLALPASSVHRILEPLVRLGLAERAPQRRYRIGMELFRIAARIENRFELITIAKPLVAEIAVESKETCILGLLTPSRSRIVLSYKIDTPLSHRFKFDLLTNITPVWGSLGRSILAWLSPADVRRALADAEPSPVAGESVPDWNSFQSDLKHIRERGVAISHGQRAAPNAVGVSAAFFDASGQVRGGLGVVAPDFRMSPARIATIETLVKLHARHLSHLLGQYGGRLFGMAGHPKAAVMPSSIDYALDEQTTPRPKRENGQRR
ncbi:MAG: IclR family transcriptional regulator [Alphaproteobacteria bacterium]|nr:IclR family transcriptional regulator [Alphaproteobacteria bacterium]